MSDAGGESAEQAPIIDWAVAERVARWASARTATPPTYRPASMQRDFDEMTARAEGLVAEATGLAVGSPARGRVIDRPDWVAANIASFQRLLGPTLAKLAIVGIAYQVFLVLTVAATLLLSALTA